MRDCENRKVALHYFKQIADSNKWKCACDASITQAAGKGYTNLITHIKKFHPNYHKETNRNQSTLSVAFTIPTSAPAKNAYCWVKWVCLSLKPFSFVDELTRQFSNLSSISINTFMKYMHLVTKEVEQGISQKLPDKFAIALDAWSAFSTYCVGIFGISSEANGYQESLLSFSPL